MIKRFLKTLVDLTIVVGVILGVAYATGLLTGFPKGNDIYAYLTKIRLIDTYFPHINWNPFWDSGTPFSIWSYPPLAMTSTTFILVKLLGLSYGMSLTVMAALAFCLLGIGLYGFASETTERRFAGFLAVILFVSSPASWNWWAVGNYVRVFGMGFFSLTLWAMAAYMKRYLEGRESRFYLLATLFFSSLAVSSHLLMGGITLLVVFLYILFTLPTLGQKIKFWLLFLTLPFLAAAYYYLPMFLTGHIGSRFIGINPAYPIPILNWFFATPAKEGFSLSPILSLTFITGFILALIFFLFRRHELSNFEKGSLLAFGFFVLGNIAYSSVGFLPFYPETGYIVGFPPITAFALLSFTLAAGAPLFLGVVLPKILPRLKLANLILILLIVVGAVNIYFYQNVLQKTVVNLSEYGNAQDFSQHTIQIADPNDFNHRFGTDSGLVADWFTYRYNMPQTRDYFAQGIPYVNWQNWMEMGIWYWKDNWNETRFLLDWYALKYVFVFEPHFNINKFLNHPDEFSVVQKKDTPGANMAQFEYRNPSPIVSATNTPTMLVVGAYGEYDVFLRTLAQAGLNSKKIIPIFSSKNIDSFSLEELKKFDLVFLYNYSYSNFAEMEKVLSDYLQSGGKVMVETFRGKEAESAKLPQFFPAARTKKTDVPPNWGFTARESNFLKEVNLNGFAEASYLGSPWHVSLSAKADLAPEAEVILENQQGILLAAKKFGQGKIIWSGINFPFHVSDKKSPEEIKLFQNIMAWFDIGQEYPPVSTVYKFIHPEKREIQILAPAKGILFKETGFMDWQAPGKIYFAGPGFMYIPLTGTNFPKTIILEYHLSLIEKLGFILAILVWLYFVILLLEMIIGRSVISSRLASLLKKSRLLSGASGWWDKEEE